MVGGPQILVGRLGQAQMAGSRFCHVRGGGGVRGGAPDTGPGSTRRTTRVVSEPWEGK